MSSARVNIVSSSASCWSPTHQVTNVPLMLSVEKTITTMRGQLKPR